MQNYFEHMLPEMGLHAALILLFIAWLFRNYFKNKQKNYIVIQFIYLFSTGITALVLLMVDKNLDWLSFAFATPFALLLFWFLCIVVIITGNIHRKETKDTLREIGLSIMPLLAIGVAYLILIRLSGKIGG